VVPLQLKVNEEGSVAAAASMFQMVQQQQQSRRYRFKADHPFDYLLATNNSVVLFNGIFQG
jgi:serine protease inhibitor